MARKRAHQHQHGGGGNHFWAVAEGESHFSLGCRSEVRWFRALVLLKFFLIDLICLDVEEVDANIATVPGLSKLLEGFFFFCERNLQRFLRGF